MKQILVIDESAAVQETLALILGREFVVLKRPLAGSGYPFAHADEEIDLLILGVTPTLGAEQPALLRFAAQAPFAVLFLVDSKSTARAIEDREQVGCLAKPFNPYELIEKVRQLLARRSILATAPTYSPGTENQANLRYLEYPYLSRIAASLVHRFAATPLPILISGEIGCGQERVARVIFAARATLAGRMVVIRGDIGAGYLAQKSLELSWNRRSGESAVTLLIENLDKLSPSDQAALLNFLEAEEGKFGRCRLLATARADLLEKVHQGDFLDALYYKLATLILKLPPLRERREDIPAIAGWFARFYGEALGLGEVTFSAGANERLSLYLWFGNLSEMETVVARTLAARRKTRIEASDLIFDFSKEDPPLGLPEFEEFVPAQAAPKKELTSAAARPVAPNGMPAGAGAGNGHGKPVDLDIVIHELAHELKNPMVTIKTFAQLLGERYQDENFRARFQDVVGGDIERMDDLLEVMIEFADFSQPRATRVPLEEKLRTALGEIAHAYAKRQTNIRWKGNGYNREIRSDEAQLKYALKLALVAVFAQAKTGSEIEIDVGKPGCVAIAYQREGARVAAITHYFRAATPGSNENILPLRLLLAKQLVERNGGRMIMDQSNSERDILRMEFPIA
jgi:DNA-binding NtrC family response regulator